jgi:hypothetical protein
MIVYCDTSFSGVSFRIFFFFVTLCHSAGGGVTDVGCRCKVLCNFQSTIPVFMSSNYIFGLITMARVKKAPGKSSFTNKRGLAAKVVAMVKAAPSNCHIQPTREHNPPTFLTQDQNNEVSRLGTSALPPLNPQNQGKIPRMTTTLTMMTTRRGKRMTAKTMTAVRTSREGRKVAAPMRGTGMARIAARMMVRMRGRTTMVTPPLPGEMIAHRLMEYPCEFISICYVSIYHYTLCITPICMH